MFRIENVLLLMLILVCALISFTIVQSLTGGQLDEILSGSLSDTVLDQIQPLEIDEVSDTAGEEISEEISREREGSEEEGSGTTSEQEGREYATGEEGWQIFRSEGYAFEIHYPPALAPKSLPNQASLNAALNLPEDTPVWEFFLQAPSLYSDTNLASASLVIQISRGEEALAACGEPKPGSIVSPAREGLPQVTINGISFTKDITREGVMGGFYELISYRAQIHGACYELTEVISSSNLESYADGSIEPFSSDEIVGELDRVLSTFRVLETPPTFPEITYPDFPEVEVAIPKSSGGYADGIDVSHWQNDIGWLQVAGSGISFAFIKATEGVGFTDNMLLNNMAESENAGVYTGVYHFARPDLGNTGQEEAEYFLSVAGDYLKSGYLRPILDLEVRGSLGKAALSAWVMDWMQTVENQSGIAPLVYTNLNYVNNYLNTSVTQYDLWIAYWTNGCDKTVTPDIPPTGKWPDWAFWQYCVAPAGTVPGINTPIDLDIYNGNEAGLSQYDAASPLWVSLIADASQATAPYYADLTVNVNGDATGPIDYYLWFDCASLENDVSALEEECGGVPFPPPSQCVDFPGGKRCTGVDSDQLIAENTYQDVGDFTPKVVVERGGVTPAEDRFNIRVTNPILSITTDPPSGGGALVGFGPELTVSVNFHGSVAGVLQAELLDETGTVLLDSQCTTVPADQAVEPEFTLRVNETEAGLKTYQIGARYRPGGSCPVGDVADNDRYTSYDLDWSFADHEAPGIYDHTGTKWHLKGELSPGWVNVISTRFPAGDETWIPVQGDWNGDGLDTIGFYVPASKKWYLKADLSHGWTSVTSVKFGAAAGSWIPITGDWDGDGTDTIGFYAPDLGKWYLKGSILDGWGDVDQLEFNGGPGWRTVVGDWNGDGLDTPGFYVPDEGKWYLKNDLVNGWTNFLSLRFGSGGEDWDPVAGDWNETGADKVGFYNSPGNKWYFKGDLDHGWQNVHSITFGIWPDVVHPSTGQW